MVNLCHFTWSYKCFNIHVSSTNLSQCTTSNDYIISVRTVLFQCSTFWHYSWAYECYDMRSALSAHRTTGSNFMIKRVEVWRTDAEVYFDEVYLGRAAPTSDSESLNKDLRQCYGIKSTLTSAKSIFKSKMSVLDINFSVEIKFNYKAKHLMHKHKIRSNAKVFVSI